MSPPPPSSPPPGKDQPPPRLQSRSRNARRRRCPWCGRPAPRCGLGRRLIHDLGDAARSRPVILAVVFSKHHCGDCRRVFGTDLSDLALPKCRYTHRVQEAAVRLVLDERLAFRPASARLWQDHCVFVPWATIQNWTEAARRRRRTSARSLGT